MIKKKKEIAIIVAFGIALILFAVFYTETAGILPILITKLY
jgi:hypothetical protein